MISSKFGKREGTTSGQKKSFKIVIIYKMSKYVYLNVLRKQKLRATALNNKIGENIKVKKWDNILKMKHRDDKIRERYENQWNNTLIKWNFKNI